MILRSLATIVAGACLVIASSTSRYPLQFLARVESPSIETVNHRVTALSSFDLALNLYHGRRRLKLQLEPNHDIIPEGATINFASEDGTITHSEPINRLDHKVFRGIAQLEDDEGTWETVGWARITILRDGINPLFQGAFTVDRDNYHIHTNTHYTNTRHQLDPQIDEADDEYMVAWRDSDISSDPNQSILKRSIDPYTCASDNLMFNVDPKHPVYNVQKKNRDFWGLMPLGKKFGKRQIDSQPANGNQAGVNLVSTIGQSSGCPSTRKVALVGVASDCTYTGTFNSTESLRSNVINNMNSASSVWENTFQISLGLQNLTVMPANCPGSAQQSTPWNQDCDSGVDITQRLNLFSGWRGTLGDSNSHWTLLTNCNTGEDIGLAWLGQACVQQAQTNNATGGGSETVSGANVVAKTSTEWQVIAHETGHTYGAVHDCMPQTCADSSIVSSQQCCPLSASTCNAGEKYIMNPFTVAGITQFSPCTVGNICSGIGRNAINTSCLKDNKGVVTITGQQCGNGIVEEGEQCDCGGVSGCGDDPCCDAKTCKFKDGAVCDDANEECCHSCQFARNGTVCRPSTGSCNPQEVCTGTSATCPPDITAPDGQSCTVSSNISTKFLDTSQLACASGQCTSRDLQCETVMSAYTNGNNDTYACDSDTCTMSCASPAFGPGICYGLQQNLLDGTPCGGGGMCKNGQCQGSSTGKEIANWITGHKGLVIGLAAGLGTVLLLIFGCCIYSCCARRKAPKQPLGPPPGPPVMSWYGGPPPMQQQPPQQENWNEQPGWRPPPLPRSGTASPAQSGLYGNGIIGGPPSPRLQTGASSPYHSGPSSPYHSGVPAMSGGSNGFAGGWNGPPPPAARSFRYA